MIRGGEYVRLSDVMAAVAAYRTSQAQGDDEAAPFGYVSRHVIQVKEQRETFPGEEPDYLWQFTPGTKHLESFEGRPDQLEVIRLYTRQAPRAVPSGWSINYSKGEPTELIITAPMGDPGGMTLKLDKYHGRLEERLLRALAVAIIGDPK